MIQRRATIDGLYNTEALAELSELLNLSEDLS